MRSTLDHLAIYTNGAKRTVNIVPSGSGPLRLELPDSAIRASILLQQGSRMLPYHLDPPIMTWEEHRGYEVVVTKGGKEYKGILDQVSDTYVTMITDANLIRIARYDSIVGTSKPGWIDFRGDGEGRVTLTYLFSGLKWQGYHTAVIDLDRAVITHFQIAGIITNTTGKPFQPSELNLIAGDLTQFDPTEIPVPRPYRNMARVSFEAKADFTTSDETVAAPLSDYVELKVSPRVLDRESHVQFEEFTNIQGAKLYFHNIDPSNLITFGYRFKVDSFIPAGSVFVYTEGKTSPGFLGTVSVKESRRGDEIDLNLGRTTVVKAESIVESTTVEVKDKSGTTKYLTTEKLTTTLTNRDTVQAYVILRRDIGDRTLVEISCDQYLRKKTQLEFLAIVNAGESTKFECTIKLQQ